MRLISLALLALSGSASAQETAADQGPAPCQTRPCAENKSSIIPQTPAVATGSAAKTVAIQQLLRASEQARQRAEALGYEWSTIRPLLKQAKAALEAGDQTQAVILLRKAKKHAELAIAQAKYADENWHSMMPSAN